LLNDSEGIKKDSPFLYLNSKAYLYGEELFEIARAADEQAKKIEINIILSPQPTGITDLVAATEELIIFAQHIDLIEKGIGHGALLPEAVKAAGAEGVILNHAEKPLKLSVLSRTVARARSLGLLTVIAASSAREAAAAASLAPDMVMAEPAELIGSGKASSSDFISETLKSVKQVDPAIKVIQGAGISAYADAARIIKAGADGVGTASGVFQADNPVKVIEELVQGILAGREASR